MFSRELFLCLTLLFDFKSCNMLSHSDSTKLLVLGDRSNSCILCYLYKVRGLQ